MIRQRLAFLLLLLPIFSEAAVSVCTNGYTLTGNKCLKYFPTAQTHKAAEATCRQDGATLVTMKNAVDNRGVATIVGTSAPIVWVGLYCFGNLPNECQWDDSTGSAESYNNFASGFPVVDVGQCVYYSTQGALAGRWLSGGCDNEAKPFVCELPTTHADNCTNNYNGYCYTVHNAGATFTTAQQMCEQECGNLASIHSANENRYVTSILNSFSSYCYAYIGGISPSSTVFQWVDGSAWTYSKVDSKSTWVGSCILISNGVSNGAAPGGYWTREDCAANHPYLCKRPAGTKCNGTPAPVTVTPIPSNPSNCNSGLMMTDGVFTSPNYPSNYDNNVFCAYQLPTVGSARIQLRFNSFSTETNYDKVTVYDGNSNSSLVLGTYSGSVRPSSMISSGNNMFVTFKSDGSNVATGFEARFLSYF